MNDFTKIVPLGELIKPHGIRGELKILFFNEASRTLKNNQEVYLTTLNDKLFEYKVEKISYSLKKNRIKFFEIDTVEDAEKMRGWSVCILRSDLPKLSDDEYYLNDLIDYNLNDSFGKSYGLVLDVLSLPANNVLNISFNNTEYLIPLIDDVVLKIDHKNKIIIIDPIEGLFN